MFEFTVPSEADADVWDYAMPHLIHSLYTDNIGTPPLDVDGIRNIPRVDTRVHLSLLELAVNNEMECSGEMYLPHAGEAIGILETMKVNGIVSNINITLPEHQFAQMSCSISFPIGKLLRISKQHHKTMTRSVLSAFAINFVKPSCHAFIGRTIQTMMSPAPGTTH